MNNTESQKVKCPNGHKIEPQSRDPLVAEKNWETVFGETYERNYCRECGEKLEEIDSGYRVVKIDKEILPSLFIESDLATQVTNGLPKDAEFVDFGTDENHLLFYFSSTEWVATNLSENVKEIEVEFTDHEVEN